MKKINKINAEGTTRANYTLFNINPDIKEDEDIVKVISKLAHKYTQLKDLLNDKLYKLLVKENIILNADMKHNLIPTTGFNVLTRILSGDTTYTGEVNYGALGTGVSPVFTSSSTQLTSEQYRKVVSSSSFEDNILYIDTFIADSDVADDNYTEFGYFIDGTASADTGQAWSLLATGGWTKSGSLFVSGQYSFTNA